ncbi:MAG: ABC transporter substrate-binding protein [Eubacteriales bacterium]|nr:ABC transporter substrate-binding protein [Eubacteriales bacterium]
MREKILQRTRRLGILFLAALMLVSGCGTGKESGEQVKTDAPELPGLACIGQVQTEYAECFAIYNYEGGYQLLEVKDGDRYLLIPEDKEAPEGLDEEIILLQKPLDHIYLAATSAMALFRGLDAVDAIRFSGTDVSGWYIEEAAEALNDGRMLYAGKYSEPDYELLLEEGCDLAIESTMILHSPKVQEMIESLGIPVFTDRSSYEPRALGRTEWIKVYGALTDKSEEAEVFFRNQTDLLCEMEDFENTGKTVAFFYISESGYVVVRKSTDYVADMINTAGGTYVFSDLEGDGNASSSVNLSMEEFYAAAADADYLIYNSTIQEPVNTMQELLDKDEVLADFKAVQEENVWCVGKNMYQATDITGEFILDIHKMLKGEGPEEMTFLTPIVE